MATLARETSCSSTTKKSRAPTTTSDTTDTTSRAAHYQEPYCTARRSLYDIHKRRSSVWIVLRTYISRSHLCTERPRMSLRMRDVPHREYVVEWYYTQEPPPLCRPALACSTATVILYGYCYPRTTSTNECPLYGRILYDDNVHKRPQN